MTKRLLLFGLLCGLLASSTGCGLLRCVFCPGAVCDPRYCPPTPGPACGPACASACGPVCPPACEPACDPPSPPVCQPPCGGGCAPVCDRACGAAEAPCGPLTWVFRLFEGECWYGDGCGEPYYGHFCGDPPDCCDPCDCWGNYTGGGVRGYPGGYAPGTASQRVRVAPAPEVVQRPKRIRQ